MFYYNKEGISAENAAYYDARKKQKEEKIEREKKMLDILESVRDNLLEWHKKEFYEKGKMWGCLELGVISNLAIKYRRMQALIECAKEIKKSEHCECKGGYKLGGNCAFCRLVDILDGLSD